VQFAIGVKPDLTVGRSSDKLATVCRGLDRIPALLRLMIVMTQSLKWQAQRICAYLQGQHPALKVTGLHASNFS
jgi:hypothetical protein